MYFQVVDLLSLDLTRGVDQFGYEGSRILRLGHCLEQPLHCDCRYVLMVPPSPRPLIRIINVWVNL